MFGFPFGCGKGLIKNVFYIRPSTEPYAEYQNISWCLQKTERDQCRTCAQVANCRTEDLVMSSHFSIVETAECQSYQESAKSWSSYVREDCQIVFMHPLLFLRWLDIQVANCGTEDLVMPTHFSIVETTECQSYQESAKSWSSYIGRIAKWWTLCVLPCIHFCFWDNSTFYFW